LKVNVTKDIKMQSTSQADLIKAPNDARDAAESGAGQCHPRNWNAENRRMRKQIYDLIALSEKATKGPHQVQKMKDGPFYISSESVSAPGERLSRINYIGALGHIRNAEDAAYFAACSPSVILPILEMALIALSEPSGVVNP
jgi:hypothetical protein